MLKCFYRNKIYWGDETPYFKNININTEKNINFLKIIDREDDELIFSNLFKYVFEKTNITKKFFEKYGINLSENFFLKREEGDIDILLYDNDNVIVTENIVNGIKRMQETNLPFTPTMGIGGVDNNGIPLGFAADIDINQLAQQLGLQSLNMGIPQQAQPQQQSGLFGYTNPLTGSNHIYTREEVGSMSSDEFARHEKKIDAQTRAFSGTMPTKA